METVALDLQNFVGLLVILGAIAVALICDYLKRDNERLRAENIALRNGEETPAGNDDATGSPAQPVTWLENLAQPVAVEEPAAASRPARPGPGPAVVAASNKLVATLPRPAWLKKEQAAVESQPSPVAKATELAVPAGVHTRLTLSRLMDSPNLLKGAVFAVRINDYQRTVEASVRAGTSDFASTLEGFIGSLLDEGDFACRSFEDEYLLVFPGASDMEAQRRIRLAGERLWDFQVRSMESAPVMFSWGAVEAHGERMADAVATARDRMHQTQQNPKTVAFGSRRPMRRRAVNQ